MVPARGGLRDSGKLAGGLGTSKHPHCVDMLTTSGFFPCSIDREYLYGYAADGYRSPLFVLPIMDTQH